MPLKFDAAIWFAIQFVACFLIDLSTGAATNVGLLRSTAVIAAWGTASVFVRGRIESVVIPMLGLTGFVTVALEQGHAQAAVIKAIAAVVVSWFVQRPFSNHRKLQDCAASAGDEEGVVPPSARNSIAAIFLGGVSGASVFGVSLALLGAWMTLTEALLMFAAAGVLGACSCSLRFSGVWLLLYCGVRFGISVDLGFYVVTAWCAMLAGRGGAGVMG